MFRDGYLTEALGVERAGRHRRHDRRAAEGPPDPARHHLRRGARVRARGGHAVRDAAGAREAEALAADEMWLSSSTKEVLAVTTVDGKPFGGGVPGPVFRSSGAVFQAQKPKAGRVRLT